MSREYCGAITYSGRNYDVHWDSITHLVFISQVDNPSLHLLNYDNFRSETAEKALETAMEMLKSVLGKNIL